MQTQLLEWHPAEGWQPVAPELDGPASLVLYFGATDRLRDGDALLAGLRQRHPQALLAGCSTGTCIFDGDVRDDEVVAVAVRFEQVQVRGHSALIGRAEASLQTGLQLGRALQADDLAMVLVLADGGCVNGAQLATGLTEVIGQTVPVVGGLAGDGARFQTTLTALDGRPITQQVVAIGFYGRALRCGAGAVGGWDAFGPARRITRSEGAVLYELDGEPALDLYERYLGDEAQDLPGSALLYPLRIWSGQRPEVDLVRTVLAIDREAGSMTFAGDLPQGWSAQLMRGHHERLVQGAERAAQRVAAQFSCGNGSRNALALMVSCVGRRLLMEQRTADEVEAVQDVFGTNTHGIGFYSYGELAPHQAPGGCELHNQTMTVTLITEDLG